MAKWKTIKSKKIAGNPFSSYYEDDVLDPAGNKSKYFWLKLNSGGGVGIVPLTDKNEVYLIKQYRYVSKKVQLELPGGGVGNMTPLQAAKKELLEETGFAAKKWKKLNRVMVLASQSNAGGQLFLAQGLKRIDHGRDMEKEAIFGLVKVSLKKALKMVHQGKIKDSFAISGLTLAAMELGLINT